MDHFFLELEGYVLVCIIKCMWCRMSSFMERRAIVIFWAPSFTDYVFLCLYIDVFEKVLFYYFQAICIKLDQSSVFQFDLMIFKTILQMDQKLM